MSENSQICAASESWSASPKTCTAATRWESALGEGGRCCCDARRVHVNARGHSFAATFSQEDHAASGI